MGMNKKNRKLTICHLYSEELNLYGDRGNIIALSKRCEWRGIETNIICVGIDEKFSPLEYDIIFLGGGQDYEQSLIHDDLIFKKGNAIKRAVQENVVFLCICGGYQMMGEYYIDQSGKKIECLGAIPVKTKSEKIRLIGNIICENDKLKSEGKDYLLIGFENHSGRTYLGENVNPLGKVITGFGNNGEDFTEGARYKNVFCTYMHGSFLPKNPDMADKIIQLALARKYPENFKLEPLEDIFEKKAREIMIEKKEK